jgi:hypothetical protein
MFKKECSKCGIEKEPSYVSSSYCKACKSEFDKARRLKKRLEEGKRPWGSGKSTLCSRCGNEKGEKYLTSGYCGPCKCAISKEKLAQARIDKGMRPFNSGRSLECCRCKGPKENPNSGYCLKCGAETERERRLRNKQNPEFLEKIRLKVNYRYLSDEEFRKKKLVNSMTNKAMAAGILTKQPCEVCGKLRVDAHHDDYNRPFDVRWLCRLHHNEHHRRIEKLTENQNGTTT